MRSRPRRADRRGRGWPDARSGPRPRRLARRLVLAAGAAGVVGGRGARRRRHAGRAGGAGAPADPGDHAVDARRGRGHRRAVGGVAGRGPGGAQLRRHGRHRRRRRARRPGGAAGVPRRCGAGARRRVVDAQPAGGAGAAQGADRPAGDAAAPARVGVRPRRRGRGLGGAPADAAARRRLRRPAGLRRRAVGGPAAGVRRLHDAAAADDRPLPGAGPAAAGLGDRRAGHRSRPDDQRAGGARRRAAGGRGRLIGRCTLAPVPPVPMPDDWQRALVVAAHPDDIEYGAAAAVAVWTAAGKEVRYLLATRGEAGIAGMPPSEAGPLREGEERRSAAKVGVREVEFLDHRDGVLSHGPELRRDLAGAIRRHRPELVVTMYGGDTWTPPGVSQVALNSADHRALTRSVLDAVADAGNEWIFPDLVEEPWRGVQYIAVQAVGGEAPHLVDVSSGVEAAVASLTEHRRYLEVLSDVPVEEQARQQIDMATLTDDGARRVGFTLYWG